MDLICDVTVRCVNRGFELPPKVLALVAERGITLAFDIFCKGEPRTRPSSRESGRTALMTLGLEKLSFQLSDGSGSGHVWSGQK